LTIIGWFQLVDNSCCSLSLKFCYIVLWQFKIVLCLVCIERLEDSEGSSFGTSCKLLKFWNFFLLLIFKNHFLLSFLVYEQVHLELWYSTCYEIHNSFFLLHLGRISIFNFYKLPIWSNLLIWLKTIIKKIKRQ
jgi:hypothetical protein